MERIQVGGLRVAKVLHDFIEREALPGTGVAAQAFWTRPRRARPRPRAAQPQLLAQRDELQARIDAWHREHAGQPVDPAGYEAFLREIGYLRAGARRLRDRHAERRRRDRPHRRAAARRAGARTRATRSTPPTRAGASLYDALYGTDAIPETDGADARRRLQPGARRKRGRARARRSSTRRRRSPTARHADAPRYAVADGRLAVSLAGGGRTGLARPAQFVGYRGDAGAPLGGAAAAQRPARRDPDRPQPPDRQDDPAGVADVVLESALSRPSMDFEDSVAAVDAEDKVGVYRNWLGLMKGDL